MLTTPTTSDSYRLQTDASGLGIGAVPISVARDEEEIASSLFFKAAVDYSLTVECLPVVAALKYFECYLDLN